MVVLGRAAAAGLGQAGGGGARIHSRSSAGFSATLRSRRLHRNAGDCQHMRMWWRGRYWHAGKDLKLAFRSFTSTSPDRYTPFPGAGTSMLAERLPGLLPDLADNEVIEVRCNPLAVCALSSAAVQLLRRPPVEDPHYSAPRPAIICGGSGLSTIPCLQGRLLESLYSSSRYGTWAAAKALLVGSCATARPHPSTLPESPA
jgi:hypothetical protein